MAKRTKGERNAARRAAEAARKAEHDMMAARFPKKARTGVDVFSQLKARTFKLRGKPKNAGAVNPK